MLAKKDLRDQWKNILTETSMKMFIKRLKNEKLLNEIQNICLFHMMDW